MKINISFKNQDVGKEETPTSNDLFSCLKGSAQAILQTLVWQGKPSFYGDSRTNFGSLTHCQINMTESHDRLEKV